MKNIYTVMSYDNDVEVHYVLGGFTTYNKAILGIVKHCLEYENGFFPEKITDDYFRVYNEDRKLKCSFTITEVPLE